MGGFAVEGLWIIDKTGPEAHECLQLSINPASGTRNGIRSKGFDCWHNGGYNEYNKSELFRFRGGCGMDVEAVINRLGAAGHKLTPKRKAIVEILLAKGRHLSAKEILQEMQARFPRVSFDTVYRNLHLLEEMKIISALEMQDGGCRFKVNFREDHHHHWVCLGCGQTLEVPVCPLNSMKKAAGAEKFKIVSHRFEIYGYCAGCQ